jgi:allophanate hydrolase subunit 2
MSLRVLDPGLFTLVVDRGRPHHRSLGVPVGGAADRWSLAIGNALVGNPPDAAGLEISLTGPTLQAECDLACVVYGAPFGLTKGIPVANAPGSDTPLRAPSASEGRFSAQLTSGKTFTLHAGEALRIGGTSVGMRAYLCVRGGIDAPIVLGSRSSLEPLRAGANLLCHAGVIGVRWIDESPEPREGPHYLRVLDGPQVDWFPTEDLCERLFTVTPACNRMGLRLQGQPLRLPGREMVSEPVCPGSVQVTRDGQCIILGADGQTIGGFPTIAQVISADLDALGQLRPGTRIGFVKVTMPEAEQARRQRQAELDEWLSRLCI